MEIYEYLNQIENKISTGGATEHTHRPILENYIKSCFKSDNFEIINENKRIACGQPDLTIYKKVAQTQIEIGYIEAKDIGVDLLKEQKTDQLTRYKQSLENLILTDYLSFHFFVRGENVKNITIATLNADNSLTPHTEKFDEFKSAIDNFLIHKGQKITSSKKLSTLMAKKAQMMRYVFMQTLSQVENENDNTLFQQFNAFKRILIHDLTHEQFADVYAQTITYGLFTARMYDKTPETFSRGEARDLIPRSNPFLRQLFDYIAGANLDNRVVWIVDSLCDLLRLCARDDILRDFTFKDGGQDPIIHFYEHFLSEYDASLRKARGVWYTPLPVVNFIMRAIDDSLKADFNVNDGIASTEKIKIKIGETNNPSESDLFAVEKEIHRVQLLDVATGTGTFMAEAIQQIHKNKFKNQQALWNNYVDEHLLPRLHGFELLMASYTMCHFKINLLLQELGYIEKNENNPKRLSVYLTNSLEEYHPDSDTLFASWLSHEANEASNIKRDMPIMVAFGNPPYSGESVNKGDWIMKLMDDYKREPNSKQKLQERNPKWINDDYVKFMRFGQYFIEKNGEGILAYINPHGFLDNPTFRGMRWHLLKTYDKIYTIDLHGNSKKKETCPDGAKDENVFDIQQGVSINIFIKTGKKQKGDLAKVHHYDLYGLRHDKYYFLNHNSLSTIPFTELPNIHPMYFMVQKDFALEKKYKQGFSVNQLMPLNSVGIVTARDKFTIHENKDDLIKTVKEFLSCDDDEARIKFDLGKDVRDWKIPYARADLVKNIDIRHTKPQKITYRPFDNRYTYYTGNSKGFHCMPRGEVMKHFIDRDNLGLIYTKIIPKNHDYNRLFVSKYIIDGHIISDATYISPLYLYPDTEQNQTSSERRLANLDRDIVKNIEKSLKLPFVDDHESKKQGDETVFTPLDILDYIYAVLHCPLYREKYAEFLKIDFPHVPYPQNAKGFFELVKYGGELRSIHLLENDCVNHFITAFNASGDNEVVKPKYKDGHVYINKEQRFDNVPDVAWNFYIGGYQPAQKWLKDRKGKSLNYDDLVHYQKIIVVLTKTHEIMKKIDDIFVD
jgi:predicted helicase